MEIVFREKVYSTAVCFGKTSGCRVFIDPDLLLEDMLTAARKIERYTAGMAEESFLQDEKTLDAVARNLEILGEPAKPSGHTTPP